MLMTMTLPVESGFVDVLDARLHYLASGKGDPFLFLHGIPLSSYVWRNVIPHLSSLGQCVAPDLIGCGQSDKPDILYSISDHVRYIEAFIEKLNLKNITIVMHGFGSLIGLDYARRHSSNCKALVFYEAILPLIPEERLSLPFQDHLVMFKNHLEAKTLHGAGLVKRMLSQIALQPLDPVYADAYSEPFQQNGSERLIEQYIAELITVRHDKKMEAFFENVADFLLNSTSPKLLLYSSPGFITTMASVNWALTHLPNIEVVEMGEEWHLGQEVYPEWMGELISAWWQGLAIR